VFDTGMNAAVAKLADAAAAGGRARGSREPLRQFGAHPESGAEVRLMEGRFGAYVTDGTTNATLPKSADPQAITLEEAVTLLAERAAKGPTSKGRKKPAAKKPAPAAKTKPKAKSKPRKAAKPRET